MTTEPFEERINSASRDTIRNRCWSWWANVHYSHTINDELTKKHETSCAVVRFYQSLVSKIELKSGRTSSFTFGYNIFANKYTGFAIDSGWGMKQKLMILDTGAEPKLSNFKA